ncbi:MAG: peptidylprolyl isomerase [Myxococcota bacterium]
MQCLRSCLPALALLFVPACDDSGDDSGDTGAATEAGSTTTGSDESSANPTSATTDSTPPNPTTVTTTTGDATTGATTIADTGFAEESSSGGGSSSTTGASGFVVMETSMGTMTIELFPKQAPITVENFVAYIDAGFYDGVDGEGATIFHRVIPGFVIQGGGLRDDMTGKTTMAPIVNEHEISGLTNDRGTLSMARTNDPDSATSQFFMNLVDNDGLDMPPGYAVFGQIVEGLEVMDAIAGVETTTVGQFADVPVDAITITSVTLE